MSTATIRGIGGLTAFAVLMAIAGPSIEKQPTPAQVVEKYVEASAGGRFEQAKELVTQSRQRK